MSYYDDYAKARRRLTAAGLSPDDETEAISLAAALLSIAGEFGVTVQSCCEDLEPAGLSPGACIDGALIDRLWGLAAGDKRDPGQRPRCRCAPSVDIGVYHTCTHGCLYCYATGSPNQVAARRRAHSPQGERLA